MRGSKCAFLSDLFLAAIKKERFKRSFFYLNSSTSLGVQSRMVHNLLGLCCHNKTQSLIQIAIIGAFQKIVYTYAVVICKRNQHMRRNHSAAVFIIGIGALRDIDRFTDLSLR